MGKYIHQNIEKSLVYGGAMALPSDGHENDLIGFCSHSTYSSSIVEELSTKTFKSNLPILKPKLKNMFASFFSQGLKKQVINGG